MGVLDLFGGGRHIDDVLKAETALSDDLLALSWALQDWRTPGAPVRVGEAGTLYRFLRFASWKRGEPREFVKSGTLVGRPMTDDPSIVTLGQSDLLALDGGTSQWASAAALAGDDERLPHPPHKLAVTYTAIGEWQICRDNGRPWPIRYDQTIHKQAEAFLRLLAGRDAEFEPEQAEDFCFACAFGLMSLEEGCRRWPQLAGHESNRLTEMPIALGQLDRGEPITTRDHRVAQAVAMRAAVFNQAAQFEHALCVGKSCPRFWQFLREVQRESL